ncbi:hypothetical protein JOM56_013101 [Amanita muscaria]
MCHTSSPNVTDQAINRAVKNKWQHEQDISQHLIEVAGFHLRLKNSGDPHRISYMQAYIADKSATYHPGRNSFSKQAMSGEDRCPSFTERLLETYQESRDNTADVAARLEARVPYEYAAEVLLDMFRNTTLVFPRELWCLSSKNRCSLSTLNTYAALVWLINGLHNWPPDDQAGRSVAKMALPLTNDLDDAQRIIFSMTIPKSRFAREG